MNFYEFTDAASFHDWCFINYFIIILIMHKTRLRFTWLTCGVRPAASAVV